MCPHVWGNNALKIFQNDGLVKGRLGPVLEFDS